MEDSLSYEAGYDLDTVALVLIIFTSTVLVEILRYLKTAVEFMLSVVIVEAPLLGDDHVPFDLGFSKDRDVHWAITSWLRGSYDFDKERECTTARDDLEECVRQSRNFLEFLENDAVKDKIDARVKSRLERCASCASNLVNNTTESSSNDLKTVLKELKKEVTLSMAKISPAGLYFPIDADLKPFPQKSLFQQIRDLSFGSASGKCAIWWDKRLYANDASGWIIRRTDNGWEMVPCVAWCGRPTFFAVGLSSYPPASGWRPWEASSKAEMMLRSPFRFNFCERGWPRNHSTTFSSSNLTTKLLSDDEDYLGSLTNVLRVPRSRSCKSPPATTDPFSLGQPSVELRRSWSAGVGNLSGKESASSNGPSGEQGRTTLGKDGVLDGKRVTLEGKDFLLTQNDIELCDKDLGLQSEFDGKNAALAKLKIALDERDADVNNLRAATAKLQSDTNAVLHEKDVELINLRAEIAKLRRLQSDKNIALKKYEEALHGRDTEIINLREAVLRLQEKIVDLD